MKGWDARCEIEAVARNVFLDLAGCNGALFFSLID